MKTFVVVDWDSRGFDIYEVEEEAKQNFRDQVVAMDVGTIILSEYDTEAGEGRTLVTATESEVDANDDAYKEFAGDVAAERDDVTADEEVEEEAE